MEQKPPQYRVIDPVVLMNAVGNDIDAFRELPATYLRIAPPMLARLEQAVAAADHEVAAVESHSLKSSTALVGAVQLTRLVEAMETFARRADARGAAMTLPILATEFALVQQEVRDSIQRDPVPAPC